METVNTPLTSVATFNILCKKIKEKTGMLKF